MKIDQKINVQLKKKIFQNLKYFLNFVNTCTKFKFSMK